jgi:hypothetical protein
LLLVAAVVVYPHDSLALTRRVQGMLDARGPASPERWDGGALLRRLGLLALQAGTAGLILVGSLVASLIAVLLLFGLEAPGVGAGFPLREQEDTTVGAVLTLAAAALASVVAAPVFARWLVALPALAAEGLGPLAALGRSWRLTRGRSGLCLRAWAVLTLGGLLVLVLPILAAWWLLGPVAGETAGRLSRWAALYGFLAWLPLSVATTGLLYRSLVSQDGHAVDR